MTSYQHQSDMDAGCMSRIVYENFYLELNNLFIFPFERRRRFSFSCLTNSRSLKKGNGSWNRPLTFSFFYFSAVDIERAPQYFISFGSKLLFYNGFQKTDKGKRWLGQENFKSWKRRPVFSITTGSCISSSLNHLALHSFRLVQTATSSTIDT